MLHVERKGIPIVVSSPSGGGKTTLCHLLIKKLQGVERSISYTTRVPRADELPGVDYHFVDDATFRRYIDEGIFLEWARVHGHLYGTSIVQTKERLSQERDVLFVIDVQGGRQILERLPEAVLVFIVPPSMTVLEQRLKGRQSDSEEVIEKRLRIAGDEIRQAFFYTYWLINDDLDQAVNELEAIVLAERLRRVNKYQLIQSVVNSYSK